MSCSADCYVQCNTYFPIGCGFEHLCCKFAWADFCIVCCTYSSVGCVSLYILYTYAKPMSICLYCVIYDRLRACLKDYVSVHPFSLLLSLLSIALRWTVNTITFAIYILCCILFALRILHTTLLSGVRWLKGPRADLCQSSDQHPVPLPCWAATRGLIVSRHKRG